MTDFYCKGTEGYKISLDIKECVAVCIRNGQSIDPVLSATSTY